MLLTDKQEQLSLAVLHATCAAAGFAFQISGRIQDNWGWDAALDVKEKLGPAVKLWNFRIKFQLKATAQQLALRQGRYSFALDVAQYNRLRDEAGHDAPSYVIVFQMPEHEPEWVDCSPEQLVLRRCLRWVSLRGAAEVATGTTTVYIPQTHVLTPDALRRLARARGLGRWIAYDPDGVPDVDHA